MPELLSFDVAIFLCGTLAAAFVTGLSGFASGMLADPHCRPGPLRRFIRHARGSVRRRVRNAIAFAK